MGSVISLSASPGLHPRARCDEFDETEHGASKASSVPPADLSWQQTSQFMARRPFSPGTVAGGSLPALAPWLFGGLPTRTHFATSYARGSQSTRRAGWRGTPSRSHCFSQTRTVRQSRKEPAAKVPTPATPPASRPSPRLEPAQSAPRQNAQQQDLRVESGKHSRRD